MAVPELYPRHAAPRLAEALEDSPVVLVHGPRQCGKTTLVRTLEAREGYAYISFDDDAAREAAAADPVGFVADLPERAILDEVQHAPSLFSALKLEVDRHRQAGRFLLTGSSHVLLLPKLADSLAGRMQILRLHPLSQVELERQNPSFLDALFAKAAHSVDRFGAGPNNRLGRELAQRIATGGYPPVLTRPEGARRANWHRDYIDALVQRDVRQLARISTLDALPRLLALAATQTAKLFNLSNLAAPFGLSRPTIQDYFTLLERVFLLERLPPWHSNRLSRHIKTPKLHFSDTGLACALLGVDAAALAADRNLLGQILETFAFQELRRQAASHPKPHSFFHYRDKDRVEVDVVIERGALELAAVEVKAAATVTAADFRGLRKLKDNLGERFVCGLVLYDGEAPRSFGDRLCAAPISALWRPA